MNTINGERQKLATRLYEEAIKHPGVVEVIQAHAKLKLVNDAVAQASQQKPIEIVVPATSAIPTL